MHQTKNKKFLVYQQGLPGVELSCLRHTEGITLKNFFRVPAGDASAEFRSLGHMERIRLKITNSWCTPRDAGCMIQVAGTYGVHQTKTKNS